MEGETRTGLTPPDKDWIRVSRKSDRSPLKFGVSPKPKKNGAKNDEFCKFRANFIKFYKNYKGPLPGKSTAKTL